MARRNKYADKELDELQKLKYENKRLKKQVSSLRKQISRVDIDRYQNLKDLVHKHDNEDQSDIGRAERKKLIAQWECHDCGEGFMQIHLFDRLDGLFYYRKCTSCDNRTKLQPYNKKVEGITNEE